MVTNFYIFFQKKANKTTQKIFKTAIFLLLVILSAILNTEKTKITDRKNEKTT